MSNQTGGSLDMLVGTFISGYLGYVAGSRKFAGWEPIIKNYETRMKHLAYFKVFRPVTFLNTFRTAQIIYLEAILSFLFGLPNASVPISLRCLQLGIAFKYNEDTGQSPPERLYDLIEWAELHLGKRKDIAHGFRILRNLVHSTTVMSEQSALETIEHVTTILNLLYPPLTPSVLTRYTCQNQNCRIELEVDVPLHENFLGNIFTVNCVRCHQPTSLLII